MTARKTRARCPDCGGYAAVMGKRLARHNSYTGRISGPTWGKPCAQKTDPAASIALAQTEATREALSDRAKEAERHAAFCERRYLEEKRCHDSAQANLVDARAALAAFEREHPSATAVDASPDVRATATFPHAVDGDEVSP